MSRRFGRNQRRRAREALAAAEHERDEYRAAFAMSRGLVADLQRQLDRMRDDMNEAVNTAGAMSVLFPVDGAPVRLPREVTLDHVRRVGWRAHVFAEPSIMEPAGMLAKSPIETLRVLFARIDPDVLRGAIHCHVELSDEIARYAISMTGLRVLSMRQLQERVYADIAPKLAMLLAKEVKGKL